MEALPLDMRYQALPGNEYNHLGLLYQPVCPRRVFRGELKEALGEPSYPESTPLDERRGDPLCWRSG
jgi:hypothetical protein